MKKFISVVLSMIMAVSVMAMATIPAMAAVSPQSTTHARVIGGSVNGSTSNDITYIADANDPNKITFTYNGDGNLTGWEFPGLELGVDYEIISEDGNTITILLLDKEIDVVANAIVDFGEGDTTKPAEDTTKPAKPDKGETSPNTGAMTATGIAVAGAGIAILAALKKNEDAE